MFSEQTIEILDMTAADMEEILAIEVVLFSSPWTRSMFIEELHSPIAHNLVVKLKGRVAGYLTFWIVTDEVHILHIAVRRDVRRQGLASLVMEEMFKQARRKGAASAILEVRRSNEGAKKFYERFGFVARDVRPRYYSDTLEDALIMWAQIAPKEIDYERNPLAPVRENRQQ